MRQDDALTKGLQQTPERRREMRKISPKNLGD
jgi:hypothetical protein